MSYGSFMQRWIGNPMKRPEQSEIKDSPNAKKKKNEIRNDTIMNQPTAANSNL